MSKMKKIIAYCGLDCAECNAYKAMLSDDNVLREKTAIEWTKANYFNFTPDMINCSSCVSDGIKTVYCLHCAIRSCASNKNIVNCGACAEFKSCEMINDFLAKVPISDILENLQLSNTEVNRSSTV